MHLHREHARGRLLVQRVGADVVEVHGHALRRSFLLHAGGIIEDWGPDDAAGLDIAHIEAALELSPSVLLLGTGPRQRFPPQRILAACLTRGIGIEVMDNAAAARTYNVLAGEGRRPVAGFILPRPA